MTVDRSPLAPPSGTHLDQITKWLDKHVDHAKSVRICRALANPNPMPRVVIRVTAIRCRRRQRRNQRHTYDSYADRKYGISPEENDRSRQFSRPVSFFGASVLIWTDGLPTLRMEAPQTLNSRPSKNDPNAKIHGPRRSI